MVFVSCAAVMSPPGGPKDQTPPELIETFPPNGTTYFKGGRVELLFSEYIEENTVERAIDILPTLKEKPNIMYKGKKIVVQFPDSLLMNQTYIISINRGLSDEQKVKLSKGMQIAFSTGSQIDQGSISGVVKHEKDASLNLWKIQNESDLEKFYERNPDYVMDASTDGEYEFNYLSSGKYKIVAVDRTVSGMPILPGRMAYGLSWVPLIEINDQEQVEGINIRIPEKFGGVKMINAESFQESWGRISFSESIMDILDHVPLEIIGEDSSMLNVDFFQDPLDNTKLYFLTDEPMDEYVSIQTSGLKKNNSTLVDSGLIRIKMESNIDTLELSVVQPDSKYKLNIELERIKPLVVVFSNLVELVQEQNSFTLLKDSASIPFSMDMDTPLSVSLIPKENWEPKTAYDLKVSRDAITPIFGKALKDSITSINFKTSAYQGFGSLIINSNADSNKSIVAELIKMEKPSPVFRSVVNSNGITNMNNIPEGNYSLMFFQDSDNNMQYSHGTIGSYHPSEWFYDYQDTVIIRSNWDMELEEINLKQIK